MASDKISVIVVSEFRERLQMAAMVASVGAVSGYEVSVFLSMNALQHFVTGSDKPVPDEGAFGELLVSKNAPQFLDLFEQAAELGDAKIYPCSMAMDVLGLTQKDLADYIGEPLGLTKFLGDAAEGQVWSF
jgi:peroxiredoxin family protein